MAKLLYTDIKIIADLLDPVEAVNSKVLKYLYKQYYPMALKFVRLNRGNDEDANDVFQDSLIALYENVRSKKFRRDSTIKTYLYATIRNNWYSKLKKQKTELDIENIAQIEEPDQKRNETEIMNIFSGLFEQLGSSCHKILRYYYYENLSMKDIMEKMEFSSEESAKTQKYKCMKKLIQLIENRPILRTTLLELL